MLIVPLEKDIIITKDDLKYTVVEYTNYKDGGPAVYGKVKGDRALTLIYFFDIAQINDVKVEYVKNARVFNALGRISRMQHLPQPNDKITVAEDQVIEVRTLKLKSKTFGANKGLLIKDEEGEYFRLKSVKHIERNLGEENFDREMFLKVYKDYTGV